MAELSNSRWEEYARGRATGLSAADAWLAAGFNAKTKTYASSYGRALQRSHPEVTARITEIEEEIRTNALRKAEVDREWVLNRLKDNHDKAAAEKEVLDRQGNPTGEYTFQGNVANRSLELVGKELGMFVERFSIESLDQELEGMSPAELRAFVKTAATEVGLRVVEMNDDELREAVRQDPERAASEEAGGVSSVPEAGGVPPSRRH
jgi:phage terminase small subunit